ncbi:MAG: hypothetical protein IJ637_07425, partial [Prevotella sp.]|nr:hypothetical protein [Prevotella sp.]
QTDPNLAYYVMTGLENATGTIGGYNGYMREYVDHELGMELSYGMKTASLHSVTSLSIDGGREYVYGTNKYEPGTYRNYVYGLSTRNRIGASDKLHSIDLSLKYETGAADEYKEERISETDGTTGYTSVRWQKIMEYKKRYQLKKLDMDLSYRLTFTDGQESKGYAGAACTVQSVSNKHLLYTSELQYASTLLSLEGGLPLLDSRLWIEGKASYNIASKADLSLHDATTPYAVGVLLPDMAYYDANYAQGCLKITWQQPIVIKGYKSQWFASLQGNYLKTDNSLNRYNVALSVGLLY